MEPGTGGRDLGSVRLETGRDGLEKRWRMHANVYGNSMNGIVCIGDTRGTPRRSRFDSQGTRRIGKRGVGRLDGVDRRKSEGDVYDRNTLNIFE
jgi:hypothetical protein